MANRYWVGGEGSWNAPATHWAASSGGSPGSGNLPTSSDDVFFDANSGLSSSDTVTVTTTNAECRSITSTTSAYYEIRNSDGETLTVYGSASASDQCDWFLPVFFEPSGTGSTLDVGLVGFNTIHVGYGSLSGELTLLDDLYAYNLLHLYSGTFDANGHDLYLANFESTVDGGNSIDLYMGSGTWEIGDSFSVSESNGTVNVYPETSTINMTGSSSSFTGGYKEYHDIWLSGDATYIYDSNEFGDFKVDAGVSVLFGAGTTQTIASWTGKGTSGNLITLDVDGAGEFDLSMPSGVVDADYLDLSNSNAGGGATWYAGSHSADTTNNTGWLFSDAPGTTTNSSTVQGKARVKVSAQSSSSQAKSRVKVLAGSSTAQAKARIKKLAGSSTAQSRARVKKLAVSSTVQSRARVKKLAAAPTLQAKARIKALAATKTVGAKAKIGFTVSKTAQAKARVKGLAATKTAQAKARIKALARSGTASAKARVKVTQTPVWSGSAMAFTGSGYVKLVV